MKRRLLVSSVLLPAFVGPVLLGSIVTGTATSASAQAPVDVAGQITDDADALDPADEARVQDALDEYYAESNRQLFVVYVDSFDGLTGAEWADATADRSGLGQADILLAVALDERSYGYSADAEDFSDDDLQTVDRQYLLPRLREDDWAGAAVAVADGLAEVDGGSGVPWGWIVGGTVVAAGAGAYVVTRTRRRYDHTHPVVDEHGKPVDPAAILTDDELEAAAATALVEADDAVQTSAQELGFAEAQFGTEATARFRTVLAEARSTLQEAFALRQRLDDAEPETDAERREMLSRILHLSQQADTALDEQADHFDAVRDLQTRAPEALAALEPRLAAVRERLPAARSTWQQLSHDHPAGVVAAVAGNVGQAEALVATADDQVGQCRADLDSGDTAAAAVHLRTAEDATGQAAALLDALETTRAELETSRDEADDLLGRVTSSVSAVSTYVETHRGAVESTARTRLSESARLLDEGRRTLDADPAAARTALERADQLVQEAQSAAEADVAAWRAAQRDSSGRGGGVEGLVLGGILLDALRGSGSTSSRSSSRSSSTRSSQSRSRGPGSFGGSRTRTRRSGGGRF